MKHNHLNSEVSKTHKLAPNAPMVFENLKHGTIDVRTVTPEQVTLLVKDGCRHFLPIKIKILKKRNSSF